MLSTAEVVIVNSQVPTSSLDRSELRAIFSMKNPQWKDGSPMTVFVYDDRNPLHQRFCKKILKVFPYQLRKNWDRLVYSGTGQAPQSIKNEEDMIRQVSTTPGAIGYIRQGVDINDVTVIAIESN